MMYSEKLKQQVLEAVATGATRVSVGRKFKVSTKTIRDWENKRANQPASPEVKSEHKLPDWGTLILGLREENAKLKRIVAELYLKTVQ